MKEYTVKEAAEKLGMKKSSMHAVIRTGGIKSTKRVVNGIPTRFIKESDLKEYAKNKAKRLQKRLAKMDGDFLD